MFVFESFHLIDEVGLSSWNFVGELGLFVFHGLESWFGIGYLLVEIILFLIYGCDLFLVFNFSVFRVVPSFLYLLFKLFTFFLVFGKRSFVIINELFRLCDLLLIIILIFLSLFLELLMLLHLLLEFGFFLFCGLKMLLNSQLSFFVSSWFLILVLLDGILDVSLLILFSLLCFFKIFGHLFGFLSFFILRLLKMSFNFSLFLL